MDDDERRCHDNPQDARRLTDALSWRANLLTSCGLRSNFSTCLLYTSDAADERSSVDLGGRRIIKKKKIYNIIREKLAIIE